jgi:hypothetical protein
MGQIPAPPPLSKEEFEKRIKNGAKTLEEIDPEFWKWYQEGQKYRLMTTIMVISAILVLMVTIMISLMSNQ